METNDHDILIETAVIVKEMRAGFNNHLKHHFAYTLAAYGTALTAIAALIVNLILG